MASWKHKPYQESWPVFFLTKGNLLLCPTARVNLQIQNSGLMGHSSLTTPLTGQLHHWYSIMWYTDTNFSVFSLLKSSDSGFVQYHKMLNRHENMKIWSHGARSQVLMQLKPRSHSLAALLTRKDVLHLMDPLWQGEVWESLTCY